MRPFPLGGVGARGLAAEPLLAQSAGLQAQCGFLPELGGLWVVLGGAAGVCICVRTNRCV